MKLNYHSTLSYGLVTLLTAGGERIFSVTIFQCPCSATWNLPYGLVFLLVPALSLWILGFVVRARTWRLLTGCCSGGCCEHNCQELTPCGRCLVFGEIAVSALVAPLTWMAVALLGGTFYECFASGIPSLAQRMCVGRGEADCVNKLPKMPCLQNQEPNQKDLLGELRAHSQVAGWVLIAVVIIIVLIGTSVARCRSPVSFQQLKFWKVYVDQEQKILRNEATQHATKLAQTNVQCFFEGKNADIFHTPSRDAWQKISSLYTFNREEQYYSSLHKYVRSKKDSPDNSSHKKSTMVTAFTFVDSQAIDNDNC